jgi:hypothetical protein
MERRRLQQQRIKQQQRFCVSQQDITQALARMKPQRRATHDNLLNISSPSLSSVETLTIPSVSQLIEEFEARAVSTPYVSAQDFLPIDNDSVPNGTESNSIQPVPVRTIKVKVDTDDDNNNISSSISRLNNDNNQTYQDKEQETLKKKQTHQTLNNDRYKRDLPSSSASSYYSIESNNSTTQMFTRNIDINSKRHDQRFNEILAKEAQLNNALADLISLSNDADISSSISSSSRSLTNNSQRQRASSTNDNNNSISASIALLNNLLETFDLDIDDYKNKKYQNNNNIDQISEKNDNDNLISTNTCW